IALATGIFSLSMSSLAGFGAWVVVPMTTVFGWQMAMSAWAFFGVATIVIWGYLYCSYKPISHPPSASTPHHASAHFSPWRTPKAWQMAILLGVQSMLFYTLASFLPSIGTSLGLGISSATGLAFIFQMMSPLAIVVLTFLVRRGVGIRVFGIIGTLCNALGIAGLLWLPSTPILWSALMGLGCALVFTLSLMMFSLRTQNTDHARDLSGMVQAVGYAIALFGPLSMGKLFELTGSWHTPLLILLILMLINIPFGFLATDEGKIDAIDTRVSPPH
ncbi:MAG: MFS transporter, partial [Moraxella sp.]|nr:MFS transporter [Moraxella sp.]